LAEKVGAAKLDAIDIENWCYLNSKENVERNNCHNISVYEGDVTLLEGKSYDTIIANINRNILLADISQYAKCLNDHGTLFLSGFYKEDIPLIEAECNKNMLKLDETIQKGQWISLKFIN
jgi:ribosomal protein L11 methyltransferase